MNLDKRHGALGHPMKFGEADAADSPVRSLKSRTWLQLYVDFFVAACPNDCSKLNVAIAADPGRRNGCNWSLVCATEDESKETLRCLSRIENDLRFMFVLYDMETA
jgi:hypothetical protein